MKSKLSWVLSSVVVLALASGCSVKPMTPSEALNGAGQGSGNSGGGEKTDTGFQKPPAPPVTPIPVVQLTGNWKGEGTVKPSRLWSVNNQSQSPVPSGLQTRCVVEMAAQHTS